MPHTEDTQPESLSSSPISETFTACYLFPDVLCKPSRHRNLLISWRSFVNPRPSWAERYCRGPSEQPFCPSLIMPVCLSVCLSLSVYMAAPRRGRYHIMISHHPWSLFHGDVIEWKHIPRYWPFVRGIHRSQVNPPDKGQWRGALMVSLICARMNGWVNNREAGNRQVS